MKNLLLISVIASLIFLSCKNELVSSAVEVNIYQKGKCMGSGLSKLTSDSCFSYSFKENLVIDFCVTGNCCPDSNRFITSNNISNDTIKIFIKDVAPNLCRCTCKYLIHGEFSNLTSKELVINCYQWDGAKQQILYIQRVKRF